LLELGKHFEKSVPLANYQQLENEVRILNEDLKNKENYTGILKK